MTEYLDASIASKMQNKMQLRIGTVPDFDFITRWGKDHLCVSHVENGVTRSINHYRDGTLSTWTKWNENGVCTEAVRHIAGIPITMPNWFCRSKDHNGSPHSTIFSPI